MHKLNVAMILFSIRQENKRLPFFDGAFRLVGLAPTEAVKLMIIRAEHAFLSAEFT